MRVDSHTQDWQAMRVLIHTHIPCRLLVEGNAPKPLLNAEFHSAAARSVNTFNLNFLCATDQGVRIIQLQLL